MEADFMSEQALKQLFLAHPQEYLSGQQLAQNLGISRTAVWKQIQQLKNQGYQIHSQGKLGYRYEGTDHLDSAVIQANLANSADCEILTFASLNSTNDYAKQYLSQQPVTKPVVILADEQTAGHGRLGRSFYSPKTTGLYLSILLPVTANGSVIPGLLTTGTGMAVVKALQKVLPELPLRLKWINDLVVHQRKCGGILTEAINDLESNQISHLIVGIGLNLVTQDFPADLKDIAGALSKTPLDRNKLAADIITEFLKMYATYETGDFLPEYRRYSAVLGRQIQANTRGKIITGVAQDIDTMGHLLVATDQGLTTLSSGEITKVQLDPA
jgi:BirA family biotin operon repressor/biotin-[acetyl-CoA-carboxylase] ligase